jgi:5S rRNA maturation endonuclease (ribonuclease M5)
MPVSSGFILKQLARVKIDRRVELHEHDVWLRCPYHSRGNERTGSIKLNLDTSQGYRAGQWKCFGCSEYGDWNRLATTLKLKLYEPNDNDDFYLEVTDRDREALRDDDSNELPPEIRLAGEWPVDLKWRNISGKLINQLDGRAVTNQFGTRLYLPVYVHKKFIGGVACSRSRYAKRKYIFDNGPWIREALFPFDFVKRMLRKNRAKLNLRIVFLVEGVRDALNLIQHGIPALAIMGGKTVWRDSKANLLMLLDPDLVVLAFDPDKIGRKVTKLARSAFRDEIRLKRLRFPARTKRKKYDPGNLKRARIRRIIRQLRQLKPV